jgi:hypothetical protein
MAADDLAGIADIIIDVDISDTQRLMDRLARTLDPVTLAGWLHIMVGPYLRERAQDRFTSEGDDVSGKWLPLSPATVHIRESMGFNGEHPINVRTSELEQYIVGTSDAVAATALGAVLTWPGQPSGGGILGRKLSTAQSGEGRTPARPVIGLNERDLMFVLSALTVFINDPTGAGTVSVSVTGG